MIIWVSDLTNGTDR